MDDADLKRATWRSVVAFQRLFGRYAPDARLLEHPAFVASSVPASFSSLVNAAAPIDGAPLAPHLDAIRAFFADTPKWGAWIDPAATADAEALEQQGLVLDSTPVLMAAELDATERTPSPRVEPTTMDELGAVNDAAYGIPPGTMATALAGIPSTEVHAYGIREDGTTAAVAVILDVEDDAFVTFVATLPDHRGKQLASITLSHALHEADAARPDDHLPPSLQARPVDLRPPRLPPARRDPPLREAPAVSLNPALDDVRFCPRCAQPAAVDYPRSISCPDCGYGAYYNPKPVAAAIPTTPDGRIILLRRGFDPGKDLWTFPGGFVDLGETVEAAAQREAQEEIRATIELTNLVGVYSKPEERVVLIVFAATTEDTPQTTDEAPQVATFSPDEIPWEELAFWSTTNALTDFLARS